MKEDLFYQKNYENENSNLAKYGCYFLSLLWFSQTLSGIPLISFKTQKDVLEFLEKCIKKGWVDSEVTVLNPLAILKEVTGHPFSLMENSKFGILGKSHFIPPYLKTAKKNFSVGCYRSVSDSSDTHFLALNYNNDVLFDPLGGGWTSWQERQYFLSDKRVFIYG